ncbi:MAG: hypothetical protein WCU88_00780 [Elusimicrobiota bacterium]|jgi:gas vesicle protein
MKTRDKIVGAGIGMAVAAAGAYFLYGKRGAKNRAAIEGWVLKTKGEVLEKMENMKEVDEKAFNSIVEETAARYGRVRRVSASELKHVTEELKKAWTHIGKQLK